jgi:hypothetical protein
MTTPAVPGDKHANRRADRIPDCAPGHVHDSRFWTTRRLDGVEGYGRRALVIDVHQSAVKTRYRSAVYSRVMQFRRNGVGAFRETFDMIESLDDKHLPKGLRHVEWACMEA